jgi:soluble cytochrome b562
LKRLTDRRFEVEENMNIRKPIFGILLAGVLGLAACTVPAWVNTVEADAEVAAPIAASLVDVIDPALAPLVTVIENGFNALINTLNTYKSSPTATNLQAVQAAFKAVDANVAQLESAAQIKNATTASTVTAVVQLLAQAVTEIAAQVPAAPATGAQISHLKLQTSGAVKGWKAKDLKREFNHVVKGDSRFKELR